MAYFGVVEVQSMSLMLQIEVLVRNLDRSINPSLLQSAGLRKLMHLHAAEVKHVARSNRLTPLLSLLAGTGR